MSKAKRVCYVLREVEIDLKDLKAGDLFRSERSSDDDKINPDEWFIADRDSVEGVVPGEYVVSASPIAFIKHELYRVHQRFGLKTKLAKTKTKLKN